MKIHIPSTPVTEVIPQIPVVKAPIKAVRTIKSGAPPPKSPLTSSNVPTKLRLHASPAPDTIVQTPATPRVETRKNVAFTAPPPPSVLKNKSKPSKLLKPTQTTKPSHVSKAQSGGMPLTDLRLCRNALKKLKANKSAFIFNQPVDPIRDHAPKYVLGEAARISSD